MNNRNINSYEKRDDRVDESNRRIVRFVIIVLIIIIIILLLLHACYKDTGECNKTGGEDDKTDVIDDEDKDNTDDDDDTEDVISISLYNSDGFDVSTKLDIFSNFKSDLSVDGTVAPTNADVYTLYIKNTGEVNVVYGFYFEDSNPYEIDVRYRLTDASGNYIAGSDTSWVVASDISKTNINLASGEQNIYYLEWKWFESGNDTNAAGTSDYVLTINVNAEG